MRKVAWSLAHQEFIISDHYYFSKLERYARENDIKIDEVDDVERFSDYDTVIFNYPEIPFKEEEVDFIEELVRKGKTVGIFGYYKNEDRIADTCNTLSERFGIKFNGDIVTDPFSNYENDDLLIVASDCTNLPENIKKVMLACTDTLTTTKKEVRPLIYGSDTAKSKLGLDLLLFAEYVHPESGGKFIAGGTCVFWDNYSIDLYNNKELSLYILTG
ncbi:MAG TPA: hypothetical protein DEP48_04170 [Persephonella sp.]|uniref:Uncharacterized protein n=1 Tax=Persephonella marina (strain DSM 14350 / EX-H1) TaxID=123214 RepID=C0QQB7_PERMH|nr:MULTISPECIES: hypothetical protein [Persephonella]ACO03114.1 conserved hypothetical protein [Persephonella marina EX-H1]HCB69531.1 hypothetical protein [Persephonella sp.]